MDALLEEFQTFVGSANPPSDIGFGWPLNLTFVLVLMGSWYLWKARNAYIFKNHSLHPQFVHSKALNLRHQ